MYIRTISHPRPLGDESALKIQSLTTSHIFRIINLIIALIDFPLIKRLHN